MDVVVTPAPGPQRVWNLIDRLGRTVGKITGLADDKFVIAAGPDTPLVKADAVQPSLDAAMDEVAKRLRGVCQFSSETGS